VSPADRDKDEASDMGKDKAPPTGQTPYERFRALARRVLTTPKDEVDRREREWRDNRTEKKSRTTP